MKLEKIVSDWLNRYPLIKKIVRYCYCSLFTHIGSLRKSNIINPIVPQYVSDSDCFFGYYDSYPVRNGFIALHKSPQKTNQIPSKVKSININILDLNKDVIFSDEVKTFNWQQGARLAWLNNTSIIYNSLTNDQQNQIVIKDIASDQPKRYICGHHYQAHDENYIYSINYHYLATLRPDYGYFDKQYYSNHAILDEDEEGIYACNRSTYRFHKLVTLSQIRNKLNLPQRIKLNANHLLCSRDNSGIVFIARIFDGSRRAGCLMYFDFHHMKLTPLTPIGVISHYCWLDNHVIFGFLQTKDYGLCYQSIDINSGEITSYSWINQITGGDGHPSIIDGKYLVTDTYPDKYGFQRLYAINILNKKYKCIFINHHPLSYRNQCRCDFHPKVSNVTSPIYIDLISQDKRQLAYLNFDFNEID